MDNDGYDDFEYEDDLVFEESGSDADDEGLRQEIELDDIKKNLRRNPSEAQRQLESLASCYTSSVCVDAAAQLFRLSVTPQSFLALVRAIAHAPDSVEDYARAGAFDDAMRLLHKADSFSKQELVDMLVSSVTVLRDLKSNRVYLRALLRLATLYLSIGDLEAAWRVVDDELEPAIVSMNALSAPALDFEAKILKIRLCLAGDPVRRTDIRHLVASTYQIHRGARSASGTIVLQLAQALLKIEENMLDDAKALLMESFKNQSEIDVPEHNAFNTTSVPYMLILVSTVLGSGHFDPLLELPLISGFVSESPALDLPFKIAFSFRRGVPQEFTEYLQQLEEHFANARWRLGQLSIVRALKKSYLAMHLNTALQTYSRMRWATLEKLIGPSLKAQESDFNDLILDHELPGIFRRNDVDGSIDRLAETGNEWRSSPTTSLDVLSLPLRYTEQARREAQKSREDRILTKWKRTAAALPPASMRSLSHEDTSSPSDVTHRLLISTLDEHLKAMSR